MRRAPVPRSVHRCSPVLALVPSPRPRRGAGGHKVEVEPRFQLAGSHGYRLQVSARGATVTIGVSRGASEHAGSSTTYVARGVVGPNGIHANFDQFGRVEMRFHPTAEAVRGLPPDCAGGNGGAETVPGYFSGSFEFEGENGYTARSSRRVQGEVVLPPTEQCPLVAGGANPLIEDPNAELPPAKTRMSLEAVDKSGTGGLVFVARRAGKTGFYAERFGTEGRIGIFSLAYALGPRSSFTSDPQVSYGAAHPAEAVRRRLATLPARAGGRASLVRRPRRGRSPGAGRVSLTGTEFHTLLSRSFP